MRPSRGARYAAAVTLSQGKMHEYNVPLEHHIRLPEGLDLEEQFPLAVGTIGDFAADTVRVRLGLSTDAEPTAPEDVRFAGRVLQAFVDARLNDALAPALTLLASAAFYLSGRPGDSLVLLRKLPEDAPNEPDDLAEAVRWVLSGPWAGDSRLDGSSLPGRLLGALTWHFLDGSADEVDLLVGQLHTWAYANGSAHELLLADILGALAFMRVERSAWSLLPGYSGLGKDLWSSYLLRSEAVQEMWPSQQMLGAAGLYAGTSAVVQMPTSAGKTRATELVIRAAFLSQRTGLAVVVAPFRALCQEIANALRAGFASDGYQVNQLSDALQPDYTSELLHYLDIDAVVTPHVVVLTPEKLLYVLRQEGELVARIGLIIYDEGHQFDTGTRGVTYELLLTSIKRLLRDDAQSVLISAVIRNAAALATWLLKTPERIVANNELQTQRTVAFVSWPLLAATGRLEFNRGPTVEQPFFVPRVIETEDLRLKGKESSRRPFPDKTTGAVALYLALRLVPNGAVAIFCGTKASAAKIVRDAAEEVFARGVSLPPPSASCDSEELSRLKHLFSENFGAHSYLARSAELGIFAHHGNTPHGLRLAIEHAMRAGHIRLVICTSTLAQGVNLPIRYLLITNTMQGGDAIKARDFHNLMGRAGRAGMHGEGTVIFTDPGLYDQRNDVRAGGRRKWLSVQNLLAPESTEPTGSSLLDVFGALENDSGDDVIKNPSRFEVVSRLVSDRSKLFAQVSNLSAGLKARRFSAKSLKRQLTRKLNILEAVESFLMAYREDISSEAFFEKARALAKETLAYSLGDEEERQWLVNVFDAVARRVEGAVPDVDTQARFGRTLLGVDAALEIDKWVGVHVAAMSIATDEVEMLELMWPLLTRLAPEERLRDTEPPDSLRRLALGWIAGKPFCDLRDALDAAGARYPHGEQRRKFSIDMVVELCEQTFGFEFALLLAAVTEALSNAAFTDEEKSDFERNMGLLQKRLKYGLPSVSTIAFFEAGFSERVVAQDLDLLIGEGVATSTAEARSLLLAQSEAAVAAVLSKYPSYFRSVFSGIAQPGPTG